MITAPELHAARALLGIDQPQLAELSGLSASTIQRMEAGERSIPGEGDSLMQLTSALNTAGLDVIEAGAANEGAGLPTTAGRGNGIAAARPAYRLAPSPSQKRPHDPVPQ